jgi:hypothetical protein
MHVLMDTTQVLWILTILGIQQYIPDAYYPKVQNVGNGPPCYLATTIALSVELYPFIFFPRKPQVSPCLINSFPSKPCLH